jgi:hypothetical protein
VEAGQEALRLARRGGYRMLEADALVACAQAGAGDRAALLRAAGELYVRGGSQARADLVAAMSQRAGTRGPGRQADASTVS